MGHVSEQQGKEGEILKATNITYGNTAIAFPARQGNKRLPIMYVHAALAADRPTIEASLPHSLASGPRPFFPAPTDVNIMSRPCLEYVPNEPFSFSRLIPQTGSTCPFVQHVGVGRA